MRLNRLLFSRRVSVGWEFPGPGPGPAPRPGATRAAARCALLVLACSTGPVVARAGLRSGHGPVSVR
jgi:hypothetical protein